MKPLLSKNKIFSLIFAFALIIPALFLFSACGEKNYYYDITTPNHCTFSVFSFATDKDGKTFINSKRTFEGAVTIDPGYEVQGELTIKINGGLVQWTNIDNVTYYYTFTPTQDFNIVVEGTIVESIYQVSFTKSSWAEDTDLTNVFIRFENEDELSLLDFLNSDSATKYMKFNQNIKFWVYTKNYEQEPLIFETNSLLNKIFYANETENEYGYIYTGKIEIDCNYEFGGTNYVQAYVKTSSDGSSTFISYGSPYSNENLSIQIDETLTTLIIEFNNKITNEMISQLTLKINGEIQSNLATGKNIITLKRAYEYNNAERPYQYEIDLDFYNF